MKSFLLGGCTLALLLQSVCAFAPTPYQSPPSFTQLNARPQTKFRQVQNNILTRRTINDFDPKLPPHWEQSLNHAIEAAIYAPNHKRSEPWRFYLLGPKSIENVCKLNAELVASKKGEAAGEKKLQRWLQMPGWLVVTCVKDKDTTMEDPMGLAREDYAACCCAVQNLCLSLSSQGMGTKWTTGPVNFDERFAEAVGFSNEDEYTVGTIWFGTPVQKPSAPGKKMGLEGVLTRVE